MGKDSTSSSADANTDFCTYVDRKATAKATANPNPSAKAIASSNARAIASPNAKPTAH